MYRKIDMYIKIYIVIFVVVFVLYWLLSLLLFDHNVLSEVNTIWHSLTASFTVSLFVIAWFNKSLWKCRICRRLGLISIPIIEGRWEGSLYSTWNNFTVPFKFVVEIRQSLFNVSISCYSDDSVISSIISGFSYDAHELGNLASMMYIYRSKPIKIHDNKFREHYGTGSMILGRSKAQVRTLYGVYYNNPHERPTYGYFEVQYVGKELHDSFIAG